MLEQEARVLDATWNLLIVRLRDVGLGMLLGMPPGAKGVLREFRKAVCQQNRKIPPTEQLVQVH